MNNQPLSPACQQTQEAILALLDQDCLDEQLAMITRHLPNCPQCQAYQESMQNLTLSLRSLEPVMLPNGLEQRILQRIASVHPEQDSPQQNPTQSEQDRDAEFSYGQPRKPTAKLGPRLAPIAAVIMAIALALPLVYQALTPNRMAEFSQVSQQAFSRNQSLHPVSSEDSSSDLQSPEAVQDMRTGTVLEQPLSTAPNPQPAGRMVTVNSLPSEQIPNIHVADRENQPAQTEVALSLPSAQSVDNTYASKHEGDIYFDPVSDLVDF